MKKAWLSPILVLMLAILASVSYAAQTQIDQAFIDPNFGLVEIKATEQSLFSTLLYTITVSPSTVNPGDRLTIVTGIEADCPAGKEFSVWISVHGTATLPEGSTQEEILEALTTPLMEFSFDDVRTGDPLRFFCQNSVQLQFSADAPRLPGDYVITYRAEGTGSDLGKVYFTESTSFKVLAGEITECSEQSAWDEWLDVGKAPSGNGKTQQRGYVTVSDAPSCTETITKFETRTICDTGYVIEGSEATMATGLKNCVLSGTTSICGNGAINTNEECDGTAFSATYANKCTDYYYAGTTSKYTGGSLTCTNACRISLSQCTPPAGVTATTTSGSGFANGEGCELPPGSKVGQDDSTCSVQCASGYCEDVAFGGEIFGFDDGKCADKPAGLVCTSIFDPTNPSAGVTATTTLGGPCSKQLGASCIPPNEEVASLSDGSGPSTECETGWCQDIRVGSGRCANAGTFIDGYKLGFDPAPECKDTAKSSGWAAFIAFINGITGFSTATIYIIIAVFAGIFILRLFRKT